MPQENTYRVGTLTYTRLALFQVMFWMLLGDFCLQLMEQLPTALVPLQLRWVSASDALIGFLTGSLPAFLGMLLNPFVGVQSDRHRGKLGRRRPFLLWATPAVVFSLLGLGFATPLGKQLAALMNLGSASSFTVGWIGGCMVLFVVANTYIMQVYQFLFVDVIPTAVMGKFIGFYRAIGALGTFAFHYFLFGRAETHTEMIYVVSALLYAVSFLLLVWRVKEGEYAPPPEKKSANLWSHASDYFRESFGHLFFWKVYALSFCFWSALVPLWAFIVFFGTKPGGGLEGYAPTIGLNLEEFGKIRGWGSLVSVPVFFAVGPFIDRLHPVRICLAGLAMSTAAFLGCFIWAHSPDSFTVTWLLLMVAVAVYQGGFGALLPRLMQRAKYGQFVSANQIFGFSGVILAPVLCGWLIEHLRDYRLLFAWCAACCAAGFVICCLVLRDWKKLGGDHNYRPIEV
ncbi:MAG: hypothetical protein RIQ71_133 [Verrucomicrobiota bacterium]|jgi:MFS family permease